MENFIKLNISDKVTEALNKLNIVTPTKIQNSAIPLILEKNDVIAESETGSGKTLAYLLPLIQHIDFDKTQNQFIILTPTHELAIQVSKVLNSINENSGLGITSSVVIGNVNIKRQIENLKEKPQFIIGSPGRILELIKLKKITAHTVKAIVIDECDRLLDKNNFDTIKAVIKTTLRERQLLMFSATVTDEVIEKGRELMKDPKLIKEETDLKLNKNIEHVFIVCDRRDKILILRKLMAALKPKKAIAFINKTDEVEILSAKLKYHGLKADGIHGEFVKNERKKVMDDFKSGRINLLVASDIAARGLDIADVTHVINIDIPEDLKDYLHRSGRTGRVKNRGLCISIVTYNEIERIKKYETTFGIDINLKELTYGRLVDGTLHNKSFYENKDQNFNSNNKEKTREDNNSRYKSEKAEKSYNNRESSRYPQERKDSSYKKYDTNESARFKKDNSQARINFKKENSEENSRFKTDNYKDSPKVNNKSRKDNSQGNSKFTRDNSDERSRFKNPNFRDSAKSSSKFKEDNSYGNSTSKRDGSEDSSYFKKASNKDISKSNSGKNEYKKSFSSKSNNTKFKTNKNKV